MSDSRFLVINHGDQEEARKILKLLKEKNCQPSFHLYPGKIAISNEGEIRKHSQMKENEENLLQQASKRTTDMEDNR